jgi:hypothetical protein
VTVETIGFDRDHVHLVMGIPASFAKARTSSLDMGSMPSPSIAPRGVSFAQRESDPPSPAKKYAPRWVRYKRVPFVIGFWKGARQRHKQLCGVGAIGFAVDDFSHGGPSFREVSSLLPKRGQHCPREVRTGAIVVLQRAESRRAMPQIAGYAQAIKEPHTRRCKARCDMQAYFKLR